MPLVANRKDIKRVTIADDDQSARQSIAFHIEDAELEALPVEGPLELPRFVNDTIENTDAVVCDHYMRSTPYASFNGAVAVAHFYQQQFPAILCTRGDKAAINEIRLFRRHIPSLISSRDIDPEKIKFGLEVCVNEFKDTFLPSRKPWRTLIRIEEVYKDLIPAMFSVVISGWNPDELIGLPLDLIPKDLHNMIQAGYRFHAMVNIGTDNQDDLYLDKFELD